MIKPIAKIVSGYSGDPDTRDSKEIQALNLKESEIGDSLYSKTQLEKIFNCIEEINRLKTEQKYRSDQWMQLAKDAKNPNISYKEITNRRYGLETNIIDYSSAIENLCNEYRKLK